MPPSKVKLVPELGIRPRLQRIERDCPLLSLDCLGETTLDLIQQSPAVQQISIFRLEVSGFCQRDFGTGPIPVVIHLNPAKGKVPGSEVGIKHNCSLSVLACLAVAF